MTRKIEISFVPLMLAIVKLGKENLDRFVFKCVSNLKNDLAIRLVSIKRSMMENVTSSISMKNATMMGVTAVQMLPKLVIASATQKMTSKPATMMVEIVA